MEDETREQVRVAWDAYATAAATTVLTFLAFLGLGVEPPTPDWGLMLSTLRAGIYTQPLLCALPGLAIFITSLSFNLVSDGLRQAMDVKS